MVFVLWFEYQISTRLWMPLTLCTCFSSVLCVVSFYHTTCATSTTTAATTTYYYYYYCYCNQPTTTIITTNHYNHHQKKKILLSPSSPEILPRSSPNSKISSTTMIEKINKSAVLTLLFSHCWYFSPFSRPANSIGKPTNHRGPMITWPSGLPGPKTTPRTSAYGEFFFCWNFKFQQKTISNLEPSVAFIFWRPLKSF